MSFIQVDEMDFDEVLNEEFDKGQIVILKFGSEYCDACIALEFHYYFFLFLFLSLTVKALILF